MPGMPYFGCGINEITFMLVPQNFTTFQSKGKGKAYPTMATKAQRGSRCIALVILQP